MLTISPAASAAIDTVLSAQEVPEGWASCWQPPARPSAAWPSPLRIAERPAPDDEVIESSSGMDVFLDPQAAGLLGDQILDAEFDGDRVMFSLSDTADGASAGSNPAGRARRAGARQGWRAPSQRGYGAGVSGPRLALAVANGRRSGHR